MFDFFTSGSFVSLSGILNLSYHVKSYFKFSLLFSYGNFELSCKYINKRCIFSHEILYIWGSIPARVENIVWCNSKYLRTNATQAYITNTIKVEKAGQNLNADENGCYQQTISRRAAPSILLTPDYVSLFSQRSPAKSIEDIRYFYPQESNTVQCIKWTNYSISWVSGRLLCQYIG
jgi:hypothetical protein